MSLLSRLFGGGGGGPSQSPEDKAEEYQGYTVRPEPIEEGGRYRLAARIEREVDGELQSHHLIRADTFPDREEAAKVSVAKAKQVIDEQGQNLFR